MAHLLRDHKADGPERCDSPIVFEFCLGGNPDVRITKEDCPKECKLCKRPFTVFKWLPGLFDRFNKTQACNTCCKPKNACQVCLSDLEHGLPVLPRPGLGYFVTIRHDDTTINLERTLPFCKRKKTPICGLYGMGVCLRGAKCRFRHEMPKPGELSQQKIKDYYYVCDPVALKRILGKVGEKRSLETLEEETMKTLYVGCLNSRVLEQDIRDQFHAYGEIESIRILGEEACAFVKYTTREGAEKAAEKLSNSNKIVVNDQGHKLIRRRRLQVPKTYPDGGSDQQGSVVAHSGVLPRDTTLNIRTHDSVPKTDVNKEFFAEEHDRKTPTTGELSSSSSSYPVPPHGHYPPPYQ